MSAAARPSVYASPPVELHDTDFLVKHYYHMMELPGGVVTPGCWDLRGGVDAYLGNVNVCGKRVLEFGPASGFLTVEMERRGADVTAIEITDEENWHFVPFPASVIDDRTRASRLRRLQVLKQTFWHTHREFRLGAKIVYTDATNVPAEIGNFDVALFGAVLLHMRNPHEVLAAAATRTNAIVVTELRYFDIEEAGAVVRLQPTAENKDWGTWWQFTSGFICQYLGVLGFDKQVVTRHEQLEVQQNRKVEFFTVVASRP